MYQINAHAIPTEQSEKYGRVIGAYVAAYINFADIDGAYELVKYYITANDWKVTEIEDEYAKIESEEDLEEEQLEFYREAKKNGYSLIFYSYESEDED